MTMKLFEWKPYYIPTAGEPVVGQELHKPPSWPFGIFLAVAVATPFLIGLSYDSQTRRFFAVNPFTAKWGT
jgi:hypothetical protein